MKLKIIANRDTEMFIKTSFAVRKNNGYCPCTIEQNEDTKCVCKEFSAQDYVGLCHCERFEKVEDKQLIKIGKLYTHFKKGDLYKVLNIAKSSETQEEMVVYQAQYGNKEIWVRPSLMWSDLMPVEKLTAYGQVRRFEIVSNT